MIENPKWTIRANNAAILRAVDAVKRVGEVADAVGSAARATSEALDPERTRKARRALRWWGSAAWAGLLARLFGG